MNMSFQAVPQTIRVEPVFTYDGQFVTNITHYRNEVPVDAAELLAFAAAWVADWTTLIRPNQPTNVILTAVRVTSLDTEFAPGIEYSAGLPVAGSATGVGLPNNVTVAVRLLTALRGRSYRGRTFHIGVRNTDVSNNLITTLFASNLTTGYNGMRSISTTQEYLQVVVSRYEGGVLRPEGISTVVNAVQVERVIDSQRRRLPGRGN